MKRRLYIIFAVVLAVCSCTNNYDVPEPPELPDCTVYVHYSEAGVEVTIPDLLKDSVSALTDGSYATLTSNVTSREIRVSLSGSSTDGGFTYNGGYKCTIEFNGIVLKSNRGAAVDIECGKRISLVLKDGTKDSLVDMAGGTQKSCLYCKGHMEVKGGGSLVVTGNTRHAISTKEYLELKKSTGSITILSSVGNAINVGEYFQMNGGSIEATMTHEDTKGVRVDSIVIINGGTINIVAQGNGTRGIQTDMDMYINQTDSQIPTSITIAANGGNCTLPECADDPHRCMGIKADGNLTVNGGYTKVTKLQGKARGIKVGGSYIYNGGTVDCTDIRDKDYEK